MARAKKTANDSELYHQPPAMDPEAREQQMIGYAIDLAEKQLKEGTASSQVITHYLKLGASTAKLEKAKLENENKLLEAKAESLKSMKSMEELYTKAIKAMRVYGGYSDDEEQSDEDY